MPTHCDLNSEAGAILFAAILGLALLAGAIGYVLGRLTHEGDDLP